MGDNNVASIGKMLMQTQSGQSVTGVDGADIGTTFRKMVDQMTQIPGSSVSTGSQTAAEYAAAYNAQSGAEL